MTEQFWYFDDIEFLACGPFDTYRTAKEEAQENVSYTRTATIVQTLVVSRPPTLKRTWR